MESFDYTRLPLVNATLNSISTILLLIGFVLIKLKNRRGHGWVMGAAFGVSTLFLISYLFYHANVGSVPFQSRGPIRIFYFTILITHILLAFAVAPMAIAAVWHAARRRFEKHVRITKWLYPIWLYVSFTGVIIYVMLYHIDR